MSVSSHKKIALLLMAAGGSSRLGQPKQLVLIKEDEQNSQSLLCRQVSIMRSICLLENAQAFCVLGCQRDKLKENLATLSFSKELTLINNDNWSQGLSNSIAKGVNELDSDMDAVLIFLVDQWLLTVNDLTCLISEWRKNPDKIHIAADENRLGPPAIFPRSFFKELTLLSGDEGAKSILKKNKKHVKIKKMPLAFQDLDTPAQLQELIQKNKSH